MQPTKEQKLRVKKIKVDVLLPTLNLFTELSQVIFVVRNDFTVCFALFRADGLSTVADNNIQPHPLGIGN